MADSQKYSRTEQLLDKDNIVDGGAFYPSVTGNKMVASNNTAILLIPCKPNTTYTISRRNVITKRFVMCFLTSNEIYVDMPIYGDVGDDTGLTLTSTSTSESQYLCFYYAKTGGSDSSTSEEIQSQLAEVMINEGNTALPYQPYLDWLHSLRKLGTETEILTLPQTIYADGTNATVGLKGNTVQNGTPTPSNPVEVNGVGERTENLAHDISITYATTAYSNALLFDADLKPNTTYTLSFISVSGLELYTNENLFTSEVIFTTVDGLNTITITTVSEISKSQTAQALNGLWRILKNRTSLSITPVFDNVMLNTGSTALPYEPYGYKIPISSGGVTTNIYLGSTQTVRQIKKLVLTGGENWIEGECLIGHRFSLPITSAMQSDTTIGVRSMCTHQVLTSTGNTYNTLGTYTITATSGLIMTLDGDTQLASWKSWLATQYAAGTPVTVWYVLTTAETVAVNEPLMKIGDYADTLSNATSIPTTDGANTISVDTTVQPSEFTATWTGWHDASVKEKSENWFDESDFGLVEVAAGTYRVGTDVGVLPSGKYTFNTVKSSSAVQIYRTTKNGSTYNYEAISELPYTFTADGVSNQIFRSAGNTGSSWTDLGYSDIMLNTGETAQTYEPYWK